MTRPAGDLDGSLPGSGPWVLSMRWSDLLFAHWAMSPTQARQLVPEPLVPDLHDGVGWLGVVPFRMSRVRPRLLPAAPPVSRFPEVNVRTYARYRGRPGVWFLSLDAAGRVAVELGRSVAGLPYHMADMAMATRADGSIDYRPRRHGDAGAGAELAVRYRPAGPVRPPSDLERFLSDRDGLWTIRPAGEPRWLGIRHGPWPLQDAVATFERVSPGEVGGIQLGGPPDHLAFSRRVDVVAWRPMRPPTSG